MVAHCPRLAYGDAQPNVAKGGGHGTRNDRAGDPHRRLARGGLRRGEQPRAPARVVAGRGGVPGGARGSGADRLRRLLAGRAPGCGSRSSTRCRRGCSRSAGPTRRGSRPRRATRSWSSSSSRPAGDGTLLRMTETGFRERGWDEAKVAAEYADHVTGLGPLPAAAAGVRREGRARAHERAGGRRPLVGGGRPDPSPDARPAAERGQRDGDQPERAPAGDPPGGGQAPRRPRPGRPGARRAPPAASGSTASTRRSSPAPSPSSPTSARPGTPACSASSASPRRSSAARARTTRPRRSSREEHGDGRHPSPHRRRAVLAGAGVRRAHHPGRAVRLVDREDDRARPSSAA